MEFQVSFKINDKIFIRDPEGTEIGKQIVKNAIDLIYELGFEQFTFKKLALHISSTEATVYRYFENKHRLLLYILNWYWCYMEFLVDFKLQNVSAKEDRLKTIISLISHELPKSTGKFDYNKKYLNHIVITESSKAYLIKEVNKINKEEVFKPYKDLCSKISSIISEYNPNYKYPISLTSTLIETSHHQQFFSKHLPKLTDHSSVKENDFVYLFMEDFLFKTLA